jgi:hypothetical protein
VLLLELSRQLDGHLPLLNSFFRDVAVVCKGDLSVEKYTRGSPCD